MNLYATPTAIKSHLGISGSTHDELIMLLAEVASRQVDDFCLRHFFTATGTRYYTPTCSMRVSIDDLLVATSVKSDGDGDGDYEETWELTDYDKWPFNAWPKTALSVTRTGDYFFPHYERSLEITGIWGYGDGLSSCPWDPTEIAATVASTTSATISVNTDGVILPGHTIMCGAEQMFVSAVGTKTLTVIRAVNGTTATAHTAAIISTASYPKPVTQAATWLAGEMFTTRDKAGILSETIGGYSITFSRPSSGDHITPQLNRLLGVYKRVAP